MELADFEGHWHLAREIDDARAGETGNLAGMAIFTPDGQGMTYREDGVLHYAGRAPMQATRRYLWRDTVAGIAVLFDDGRDFHVIDGDQARYFCDPDTYRVTYDFAAWPIWSAVWHVTGPRKDYVMRSQYTPKPALK